MIEPLETRIAPASVLIFTDVDGDTVKITSSVGDLNAAGVASLVSLGSAGGKQLTLLDLKGATFQGANLTTAVTKATTGDGLVHIGRIDATGRDLGNVTIVGDLGVIDAGDAITSTAAVKLLNVRSMGSFGTSTQGGAADLQSDLRGALGTLKVGGDFKHAYLHVTGNVLGEERIGSISIGGSVIGGSIANAGAIVAGTIGAVSIGGDLSGGAGVRSGIVHAETGSMGAVTIGGLLRGGAETSAGLLASFGAMGAVKIAGDLQGGTGLQSGSISAGGRLAGVTIGGSALAATNDAGAQSAQIFCGDQLGPVSIGGDLKGGEGANSGQVTANQKILSVRIGGSIIGGTALQSGAIFSYQDVGPIRVGIDLRGGLDEYSGSIFSVVGRVTNVTIVGSVVAGFSIIGPFEGSGTISSGTDIGTVKIGGDLYAGSISAGTTAGNLGSLSIGGSVIYGLIEAKGNIGAVIIAHDLRGGGITATGNASSLTISGSLIGETKILSRFNAPPLPLGAIDIEGNLLAMRIGGDMRGGDSSNSGYIEAGRIIAATIGGSIISGIDQSDAADLQRNASIRASYDLGTIVVKGSLIGNVSEFGRSTVIISGVGQAALARNATTDLAIKSLTVGGRVEFADVLAGFGTDEAGNGGTNPNGSIGTVTVGGDWIASNMSAGISDAAGDGFASGDDYLIPGGSPDAFVARIARITIQGVLVGAADGGDRTGFTAQQIDVFKAGLYAAPLTAVTDAILYFAPFTGENVAIREV